jgi:hypothetical protein
MKTNHKNKTIKRIKKNTHKKDKTKSNEIYLHGRRKTSKTKSFRNNYIFSSAVNIAFITFATKTAN